MFIFLLLNFNTSLYTFHNSHLSLMSFANIFSQSGACLLILLTMSFTVQTLLLLIKFNLSIMFIMDHVFGVESRLFPILLLRILQLCILHLQPCIWLFLANFVKDIRSVWILFFLSFFLFACSSPVFPVPFVERLSSLLHIAFVPLSKINWQFKQVYFWPLYSVTLIYFFSSSFFFTNTTLSRLLYLYSKFWCQVASIFWLCFSSILYSIFWVFCLSI